MPFTPFASGQLLTAANLNEALSWVPVTLRRTADQDVTNNTALQNDDTLFFTPPINSVYVAKWSLLYSATTAQDGKIALTWPAGATCPWGYQGYDTGLVFSSIAFDNSVLSGSHFPIGGNGASNTLQVIIEATVTMGSTAGSVRLQYAQNAALAATVFKCRIGSTLSYHRVA